MAGNVKHAGSMIDPERAEYIIDRWQKLQPDDFRESLELVFLGLARDEADYHIVDGEGVSWPLSPVLKMEPTQLRAALAPIEQETANLDVTFDRMNFSAAWADHAMQNFTYEMPAADSKGAGIDQERDAEHSLWFHRGMRALRQHDGKAAGDDEARFTAHEELPRPTAAAADQFWRSLSDDRHSYQPEQDKVFQGFREAAKLGPPTIVPADLSRPPQQDRVRGSLTMLQDAHKQRDEYQTGSYKPAHDPAQRERDGR